MSTALYGLSAQRAACLYYLTMTLMCLYELAVVSSGSAAAGPGAGAVLILISAITIFE